jgi:hypothetical protein
MTTATFDPEAILARLGHPENIDIIAREAAKSLAERGFAYVVLEPGDATSYPFVIAGPDTRIGRPNREYMVSLAASFGRSYPWGGIALQCDYCAVKWADGHEYTGVIVAEFLTRLAAHIADDKDRR